MFQLSESFPTGLRTGHAITQAVLDGLQQGRVYACDDNYFIVHKAGFCSLIQQTDCLPALMALFKQDGFPQYFHVYDAGVEIIQAVQADKNAYNTRVRERVQLSYSNKDVMGVQNIEGYSIETVSASNFDSLSVFNLDLDKRFWNNKESFIQHSHGVVVRNLQQQPVSLCYAAAVAGKIAEVDVCTSEEYRGRGLAKLAVTGFINHCIGNQLIPNWDCFKDNQSSLSLSKKMVL